MAKFTTEDGDWSFEIPQQWGPVGLLECHMYAAKARDGIDRFQHYKGIAQSMFQPPGPENPNGFNFIWHPWAEKMFQVFCQHKFVAVAGCASSSKSQTAAMWAILNFLIEPKNTLVLITTTTKSDSDQRVWGMVKRLWNALGPGLSCLGKLVGSLRCLRYRDPQTGKEDEMAGIYVVAGEHLSQHEASSKFIGKKNKRVFLIADELTELSEAVMQAAIDNLTKNPYFQFIGLANPKSYYDPFGALAKPKAGYNSISVEDEEWQTELGWCLHLDGTKSPNIGHDTPIYPFIYTQANLDEDVGRYQSPTSPGFYRMIRGFWCPLGEFDTIYCEADIIKFEADDTQKIMWASPPTPCAALDPAFTNGGDRSALTLGHFGINARNLLPTLAYDRVIELVADTTKTDTPHAYQIIHKARDICRQEGVKPEHFAYDSTGGGISFGAIISREWSDKVLPVNFGGAASDMPTSAYDPTPASEKYANRVTEIWFGAQEYIRSSQITGLKKSVIKELCSRKYTEIKRAGKVVPEAETKRDMKIRVKFSPDEADSFCLLVNLAKERLGFGRVSKGLPPPASKIPSGTTVLQAANPQVKQPPRTTPALNRRIIRGVMPQRRLLR